jgi:hypothetical protein
VAIARPGSGTGPPPRALARRRSGPVARVVGSEARMDAFALHQGDRVTCQALADMSRSQMWVAGRRHRSSPPPSKRRTRGSVDVRATLSSCSACHGRPFRSPWRLLEGAEADDRAGQHRQGVEAFGGPLIADPAAAGSPKPRSSALDRPPVTTKPGRGLDHAASDPRVDPTPTQVGPAATLVVGLVGMHLGRPAPPASAGHPDRWDVVQHRLQHGRVVGVGRTHDQR